MADLASAFPRHDHFEARHLGPRPKELAAMLAALGCQSLDELTDKAIPGSIRWRGALATPAAKSERDALAELTALAGENRVLRSYLGLGYHGTLTPAVIQRNILENPGWYTQYTPYQAEISQGRMEALLNYQTLVLDLTGLEVANSSLLDEATAAAEAMTLCHRVAEKEGADTFFVDRNCHPQTLAVVRQRAEPLGITVEVGDHHAVQFGSHHFGALLQYPGTDGTVEDLTPTIAKVHAAGALCAVAADLLALTILKPPGEMGADVVLGSSQRFGVPLGYGGPHAAYMAAKKSFQRQLPGRIVGLSIDATGKPAMRLALGTREQHIRREKATSNICTAQVLLAVMASMYAVYHGPEGLVAIAERVRAQAECLAASLQKLGHEVPAGVRFDTVRVRPKQGAEAVVAAALARGINLRNDNLGNGGGWVVVALDETVEASDLVDVLAAFGGQPGDLLTGAAAPALGNLARTSAFLTHPTFHAYRAEHELLRYIHRLQQKDLSLTTSMIALGSCTMKLNATTEMYPVSLPGFGAIHPFAPLDQTKGYQKLFANLSRWLCDITGFDGCSLQPNAGSQGEYAGLSVIRAYHIHRGQGHRNICLIPSSAHGTNPATASMCGMKVVVVACDEHGNIDVQDLAKKAADHQDHLAALMITYPSTHGVFEEAVQNICAIVHEHGGQVYMDGANMNAQVGLLRPGNLGADVCHLNLHKTFCIPHGGGGPGMGPICCKAHLAPFLPGHPLVKTGGEQAIGPISAAPWGSASILTISYAYIAMMGPAGLRRATQVAIAAANYVAKRLAGHYPVLYTGQNGMVAHECIVDVRHLKATSGVEVGDIAKRLMDYGFHAPTVSFPVAGTMMIEPTESESQAELDRFCDALIAIRKEIQEIEDGKADKQNNLLKNAPHTAEAVTAEAWNRPYSRERAAFPAPWTKVHKFWPSVARVNDVHGDRNLVCACPPVEAYA